MKATAYNFYFLLFSTVFLCFTCISSLAQIPSKPNFIEGYFFGDFQVGRGHYYIKKNGDFFFMSTPVEIQHQNDNAIRFGKGNFEILKQDTVIIRLSSFPYSPLQLQTVDVKSEIKPPYDSIYITGSIRYADDVVILSPDLTPHIFVGLNGKKGVLIRSGASFKLAYKNENKDIEDLTVMPGNINYIPIIALPQGGNNYTVNVLLQKESKYRFAYLDSKYVSPHPFAWPKMIDSLVKLSTFSYLKFKSPEKAAFIREIRQVEKGMPEQASVINAIIGEIEKD